MLHFRPTTEEDKEHISAAMAVDPHHAGQDPTSYFTPMPGTENFVIEDEDGPVMYVHAENALRLFVQFRPDVSGKRTSLALAGGISFVAQQAKSKGYKEMIFDTVSSRLARFCQRFGFRKMEKDFRRVL